MISQDEIVSNAKTVTKGLEALRQEHESILGGIQSSLDLSDSGAGDENSLIQGRHVAMLTMFRMNGEYNTWQSCLHTYGIHYNNLLLLLTNARLCM